MLIYNFFLAAAAAVLVPLVVSVEAVGTFNVAEKRHVKGKLYFLVMAYYRMQNLPIWSLFLEDAPLDQYKIFYHSNSEKDNMPLQIPDLPNVVAVPQYLSNGYRKLVGLQVYMYRMALEDSKHAGDMFIIISSDSIPLQPFSDMYEQLVSSNSRVCLAPTDQWVRIPPSVTAGIAGAREGTGTGTGTGTVGVEMYIPKSHQWVILNRSDVVRVAQQWQTHGDALLPNVDGYASTEEYWFAVALFGLWTTIGTTMVGGVPAVRSSPSSSTTTTTDVTFQQRQQQQAPLLYPYAHEQGKCSMYVWWDGYPAHSQFQSFPNSSSMTAANTGGQQTLRTIPFEFLAGLRQSQFLFARKVSDGGSPDARTVDIFTTIVLTQKYVEAVLNAKQQPGYNSYSSLVRSVASLPDRLPLLDAVRLLGLYSRTPLDLPTAVDASATSRITPPRTTGIADMQNDRQSVAKKNEKIKIAVCVSGSRSRWIPENLRKGLIDSNKNTNKTEIDGKTSNAEFEFYFFFNVVSGPLVYSTDPALSFNASNMLAMNEEETMKYLRSIIDGPTSKVVSVTESPGRTAEEWKKELFGSWQQLQHCSLDRISELSDKPAVILNVYLHQSRCVEQIKSYEQAWGRDKENAGGGLFQMDGVISTREDLAFYKPLNLQKIWQGLVLGEEKFQQQQQQGEEAVAAAKIPFAATSTAVTFNHSKVTKAAELHEKKNVANGGGILQEYIIRFPLEAGCNLAVKNCMGWGGVNLRFQLMLRKHMDHFLNGRFDYYRHLCRVEKQISNPEQFEYKLAMHWQMTICNVSPDEMPVFAARHINNQSYCLTQQEIANAHLGTTCLPSDMFLNNLPVPLCKTASKVGG